MVESKETGSMINFLPTFSGKLKLTGERESRLVKHRKKGGEVLQKPKQTNFKEGTKRRPRKNFTATTF